MRTLLVGHVAQAGLKNLGLIKELMMEAQHLLVFLIQLVRWRHGPVIQGLTDEKVNVVSKGKVR